MHHFVSRKRVIVGQVIGYLLRVKVCMIFGVMGLETAADTYGNEVLSTSPKGDVVATAVEGGRIEFRSLSGNNAIITVQHKGVPVCEQRERSAVGWMPSFVFSPNGAVLASKCAWLPVTLWEVRTGRMLMEFSDTGIGYELRFSADGSRLIGSGLVNKSGLQRLSLWDVASGELLRELTVDVPLASELWERNSIRPRFAKSGSMLVIEVIDGDKRSLKAWNTEKNQPTLELTLDRQSNPDWVMSGDGEHLILREYGDPDRSVKRHRVLELASGAVVKDWTSANSTNK